MRQAVYEYTLPINQICICIFRCLHGVVPPKVAEGQDGFQMCMVGTNSLGVLWINSRGQARRNGSTAWGFIEGGKFLVQLLINESAVCS